MATTGRSSGEAKPGGKAVARQEHELAIHHDVFSVKDFGRITNKSYKGVWY